MSSSFGATNYMKASNSEFIKSSLPHHREDAMIHSSSSVSSYGYPNTNKGEKHLMTDLNRRTSQRKRAKVCIFNLFSLACKIWLR